MVTTADTEDAVTIAAVDNAAVSGGILPGGRCDTLPSLLWRHRHHQSLDTDTIRSSAASAASAAAIVAFARRVASATCAVGGPCDGRNATFIAGGSVGGDDALAC